MGLKQFAIAFVNWLGLGQVNVKLYFVLEKKSDGSHLYSSQGSGMLAL
jgi:hypothetical protein